MAERSDRYAYLKLLKERLEKETPAHRPNLFLAYLSDRLAMGEAEYGNASFDRSFRELLEEILQEDLDRAGWAYIIWAKAKNMAATGKYSLQVRNLLKDISDSSLQSAVRAYGAWESHLAAMDSDAWVLDHLEPNKLPTAKQSEEDCC